jgi:hypothetical protein
MLLLLTAKGAKQMSEMVILHSSYPLSGKEFSTVMQIAGKGYIEGEGAEFTGAFWDGDGERAIFLYGDWDAPDPEQFWEKELRYEKRLPEIEAKLGGRPATSFGLEIGKGYGSSWLALELAYQCAVRWPCVLWAWADTWNPFEGDHIMTIYTKEDMERLRAEKGGFTTTVPLMVNDEEE